MLKKGEGSIYLDHNATTPCLSEVVDVMLPFFSEISANPSSPHRSGRDAAAELEKARETVAKFINASPEEIVFNSGGTEANNHAIVKSAAVSGKNEIITSPIEHSSVLAVCKSLQNYNIKISYLPCGTDGITRTDALANLANKNTALITLMLANNETGAIQPVKELAKFAKKKGMLFHCDAVQAAGKIKLDVRELGVDMLSISAHKLYGPKGVGALYIRRGLKIPPLLLGGSQERRLRAGTENLPAIVGFAKASSIASERLPEYQRHCGRLMELFLDELSKIPDIKINTPLDNSVCNTLNISFKNIPSEALITKLDMRGICVSSASACTGLSGSSHVLKAMSVPEEFLHSSIRISLGLQNTEEQTMRASSIITETVCEIRKLKFQI